MTPKVRIEVLTLDDDGTERVDVIEAVDHRPEVGVDEGAPASGVRGATSPEEAP